MTAQEQVTILLEIKEKLGGLVKVRQEVGKTHADFGRLKDLLLSGFGMGGGMGAFGLIQQGIEKLKAALVDFYKEGIKGSSEIETLKGTIATMLHLMRPDAFLSFNDALAAAGPIARSLHDQAALAGVGLDSMATAFNRLVMFSKEAGMSIQQVAKLMPLITRASIAAGVSPEQMVTQMRRPLAGEEGGAGRAWVAQKLGITGQGIEEAMKLGRAYEYLVERLGRAGEAADYVANSMAGMTRAVALAREEAAERKVAPGMKDELDWLKGQKAFWDRGLSLQGGTLQAWITAYQYWRGLAGRIAQRILPEQRQQPEFLGGPAMTKPPPAGAPDPQATRDALERGRKWVEFDYKEKLVSLREYLQARREQITMALGLEKADRSKLLIELDDLEREAIKVRREEMAGITEGIMGRIKGLSTGIGNQGLFITQGQSRYWAESATLSRRMLDVLTDIRSSIDRGLKFDLKDL